MIRFVAATTLFSLTAGSVMAACRAGTDTVLSCTARGGAKALDVCLDTGAGEISYAYGAPGRTPELYLSRSIAAIDHRPWPGIGRSIWESTVFYNNGYAYEVFTSIDRMAENQPPIGGVLLYKGRQQVARVDCDAGSAEIGLWAVSDAKDALGLCWDQGAQIWNNCTQ